MREPPESKERAGLLPLFLLLCFSPSAAFSWPMLRTLLLLLLWHWTGSFTFAARTQLQCPAHRYSHEKLHEA